jgi:hypothetical protein
MDATILEDATPPLKISWKSWVLIYSYNCPFSGRGEVCGGLESNAQHEIAYLSLRFQDKQKLRFWEGTTCSNANFDTEFLKGRSRERFVGREPREATSGDALGPPAVEERYLPHGFEVILPRDAEKGEEKVNVSLFLKGELRRIRI